MLSEKTYAWYWKPCREPMFGEFKDSGGEPATIILQNGYSIRLPSKILSPYVMRELSSYYGWWLMRRLTTGKSPDSKCHGRPSHKRNISITPLLRDHQGRGKKKDWAGGWEGLEYKVVSQTQQAFRVNSFPAAVVACTWPVQGQVRKRSSRVSEEFTSPYPEPRSYAQLMAFGEGKVSFL